MTDIIEEKLKQLPQTPGVYIMKDANGKVIYVGKSINLKSRVSQYFHHSDQPPKTRAMVKNAADFDIINVGTEFEALILECNLIKKYRPRYNVSLKDDKMYPYVKLTAEQFPRICITRRPIEDGSRYFGPYTNAGAMQQSLKLLRKLFPLRTCKHFHKRPCLEYHIKRCLAPCVNKITSDSYNELVKSAELFLDGQTSELESQLASKMYAAADQLDFETAAHYRNLLASVKKLVEMQMILNAKPDYANNEDHMDDVYELQSQLNLNKPPRRMECFDISHIQGAETVASMVVFQDGAPDKSSYRRFKLRTTEGKPDDFLSMKEVTLRRYGKCENLPDLIVIDGGIGQLNSALEIIRPLCNVPVIGLAKQFEFIFIEGRNKPLELPLESPAIKLLQRIRDEAHRFAITYHRKLRGKRNLNSVLNSIEGVGSIRRSALLSHFKTIDKIKSASVDEIMSVPSMNRTAAVNVYNFFQTMDEL
ncbi:MAG: excinuclease ABC subunit C [Selenomonadaceae bacterium]|nr:excinuclease ABC subunit C [Selenomonadaceae bacterium]